MLSRMSVLQGLPGRISELEFGRAAQETPTCTASKSLHAAWPKISGKQPVHGLGNCTFCAYSVLPAIA